MAFRLSFSVTEHSPLNFEVYLDRPFLYMLVDTGTNLPAFIGAVTDMS